MPVTPGVFIQSAVFNYMTCFDNSQGFATIGNPLHPWDCNVNNVNQHFSFEQATADFWYTVRGLMSGGVKQDTAGPAAVREAVSARWDSCCQQPYDAPEQGGVWPNAVFVLMWRGLPVHTACSLQPSAGNLPGLQLQRRFLARSPPVETAASLLPCTHAPPKYHQAHTYTRAH